MAIRSAARGIVVKDGRILLVKELRYSDNTYEYVLPGGGQEPYEPLTETLKREMREECGVDIVPGRMAAVCEVIYTDKDAREKWPDYTHRLHHIFLCEIKGNAIVPTSPDRGQAGIEWIDIDKADRLDNLFPAAIRGRIREFIEGRDCEYLGWEAISQH